MDIQVNYWAVLLATLSSMIVGSVWYAKPVFGNLWIKLVKLDEKKMSQGAAKAIITTIVVSFLTAFVLAHITYVYHAFFAGAYSFLQTALITGFWLWLGFTAARFITHDAFEGRPVKLTVLNVAHELVTIMVMALFIGLLQP